jgi:rsbT antagonist protein RsbS
MDSQSVRVPILKQGNYLIASIQSALNDQELLQFSDELIGRISKVRARGVIIDVTELDVVDSFSTRILSDLARMIRLRGAPTVVVGIQPDVACAMVRLGIEFEGVITSLDLEDGIEALNSISENEN